MPNRGYNFIIAQGTFQWFCFGRETPTITKFFFGVAPLFSRLLAVVFFVALVFVFVVVAVAIDYFLIML